MAEILKYVYTAYQCTDQSDVDYAIKSCYELLGRKYLTNANRNAIYRRLGSLAKRGEALKKRSSSRFR